MSLLKMSTSMVFVGAVLYGRSFSWRADVWENLNVKDL